MRPQDFRGHWDRVSDRQLADRLACLEAASRDDIVRKVGEWGHAARDGADDPRWTPQLIAALLKAGLLEPVGMRDDRGREVRVRLSGHGRREIARHRRGQGAG
jgi:hypothetical protein